MFPEFEWIIWSVPYSGHYAAPPQWNLRLRLSLPGSVPHCCQAGARHYHLFKREKKNYMQIEDQHRLYRLSFLKQQKFLIERCLHLPEHNKVTLLLLFTNSLCSLLTAPFALTVYIFKSPGLKTIPVSLNSLSLTEVMCQLLSTISYNLCMLTLYVV